MVVTLGNGGYIFARSSKLTITTASATESEHYCLCEPALYNQMAKRYAAEPKSQTRKSNNITPKQQCSYHNR
jgi:hypothetical protein